MAKQQINKRLSWIERRSGHLVSLALFVALFLFLSAKAYRHEFLPPQSQPIRINLKPAPQQPEEPQQKEANVPPPPDIAATKQVVEDVTEQEQETEVQEPNKTMSVVDPAEQDQVSEPQPEKAKEVLPLLPEPMFLISEEGPSVTEEVTEPPDLEQARERARATIQALENEKFEFHKFLQKEQMTIRAQELDFNSRGLAEGAVRTFDITNIPEAPVEYVFKKYGIRIVKQRMTGNEESGFLNAAKTRHGIYTNRPGVGVYEVFQITPRAQSKMGALELEAIKERKMNPNSTQVQEVVFSVGQRNGEWDLVIRSFKARAIE